MVPEQKNMRLLTLLLFLTMSILAAGPGSCKGGHCEQCDSDGISRWCLTCNRKPISGLQNLQKCEGGTDIPGCLRYRVYTNDKPYCIECDGDKGYQILLSFQVDQNKCILCNKATHYLNNGVCAVATVVPGCIQYQYQQNTCSNCEAGKTLSSASTPACTPDIANCTVTSATLGECTTCKNEFYLIPAKTACAPAIANCLQASEETKCVICKDGFYKTAAGLCAANIANCKKALPGSETTDCDLSGCFDGFTKIGNDNTKCLKINIENCKDSNVSKSAAVCDQCMTGYALSTDKTQCVLNPKGCLTAHFDKGDMKCVTCDTANSYFSEDVKGSEKFTANLAQHWEQECKSSITPLTEQPPSDGKSSTQNFILKITSLVIFGFLSF